MRLAPVAVFASLALLAAAGAAQAQDLQLSCRGPALVMPDETTAPLDVQLTVQGGFSDTSAVAYAWGRPETPVTMSLKGIMGETLQFHGIASGKDGAVMVADASLNRQTLALVLKVRRLGDAAEDITLETTCARG